MAWRFEPLTAPLLLSAVIAAALAAFAWRRESVRGRREFVAVMTGAALWSLTDFLMLGFTDEGTHFLFAKLSWVGGMLAPLSVPAFALAYTGRDRLYRRIRPFLVGFYGFTLLVVATNPVHRLVYRGVELDTTGAIPVLRESQGPLFWVLAAVGVGAILATNVLLLYDTVAVHRLYRRQHLLVTVGTLIPAVTFVAWAFDAVPVRGLDPTPFALTVMGATFALAAFSFRLLDLTPVARHTLFEELRDGAIVVDADGRVVDANGAAAGVFEGADPVVGRPVRSVWPDYQAVVEGEADTVTLERADGPDRQFDVTVTPLTGEGGAETGRLVLLRDVTERRRLRERYQTLIEESSDFIVVLDADWTVRYLSPAVEFVLGWEPDRVTGEDATDRIHPEDREAVREALAELADSPDSRVRVEYRVRHSDGDWRVIEARGRNLLDDPVVEGIVAYGRDVTERRERERELARQNERLENFAGVVSHDLRNPLSVASGYVDLLAETVEDPTAREYVAEVATSHARMEQLIEDLLALARQERADLDPEPLDLNEVAVAAWNQVEADDATLTVEGSVTVEADRSRLTELFENLFRNAVDHAGADVAVRVGPTDGGFFVADDGPGIPEADREAVFETGYTTAEDGTGFGLSIVAEIAEAHGWTVEVGEAEGGGARFEVSVPDAVEYGVSADAGPGAGAAND